MTTIVVRDSLRRVNTGPMRAYELRARVSRYGQRARHYTETGAIETGLINYALACLAGAYLDRQETIR